MDWDKPAHTASLAVVEYITSAAGRTWDRSAGSLFDAGVKLRCERVGPVELSRGQPDDSCICGAGPVWNCAPHTAGAAIARPLRDAGERSGGGSRGLLGNPSSADRKRDLYHPAHGVVDGFVFISDFVLRYSRL